MTKKIISIVLVLIMAFGVFAVSASAAAKTYQAATEDEFSSVVSGAVNGDIIVLTADIEFSGNKGTISGKNLTVDLAGHNITASVYGIIASAGAKVTVKDTQGDGTVSASYPFYIQNGSTLTFNGGTAIASTYVNLQKDTNNTLVVNGGIIDGKVIVGSSCTAQIKNGAVAGELQVNSGATATITGGTLDAITNNGGSVVIKGGTVNGVVQAMAGGSLQIDNGIFNSYILVVGDGTSFVMNNGTVNCAEGCIFTSAISSDAGSTLVINGGTFESTKIVVNLYGNCTTTINGGTFTGATALGLKSGNTVINGGTFAADGVSRAYKRNGNGFNSTGDAIEVVAQSTIAVPALRINEGTFTSQNAQTIATYEDGGTFARTGYVFGGEFYPMYDEQYEGLYAHNVTTDAYYLTVAKAVTVANDGDTIALNGDYVSASTQDFNKTITLDLNGYTYTLDGSDEAALCANTAGKTLTLTNSMSTGSVNGGDVLARDGGSIVIDNGTFNCRLKAVGTSSENVSVITVNNAKVYGNGETTLEAEQFGKIIVNNGKFYNKVLVEENGSFEANKGTFTAKGYCIITEGTNTGADIRINGGTYTASGRNSASVFKRDSGTLTIKGGTFKGADALYLKSGDTVINGGVYYALIAKTDYQYSEDGFFSTGDTVVIDSCGCPAPSLTINKGAFWSEDGEMIGYYYTEGNELESTAFVYNGAFERMVPAEYYIDSHAFRQLRVDGGVATIDENDLITINADVGSFKVTVSKEGNAGAVVAFSDLTDGAKLSSSNQLYARTPGTAIITVDGTEYDAVITFPHANVEDLLIVTGADMYVDGQTVILDATEELVTITTRTKASTLITFGDRTGGAKVSSNGTLYSKEDGTAVITVPNSGTYEVVFVFPEPPFVFSADLLRTTNAMIDFDGTTITLAPIDETVAVSMVCKLKDGKAISFSNRSGCSVSKSGSLYSKQDATATVTVEGVDYTVVFDFPDVSLEENLRLTNAEVEVDDTTITLTPLDDSAAISMVYKLKDGTPITFSNRNGARVSSGGSLYASKNATATATINGVDYTVVFKYSDEDAEVTLADNLRFVYATVVVGGTTIVLTPETNATQISLYPTLKDGSAVTFSNRVGCGVSKSGTLYATGDATAIATIGDVAYTVVFNFSNQPIERFFLAENLKFDNATVEVNGTNVTLTAKANATQINLYPTLKDGRTATFSNRSGCSVSKSGTLYAKKNATATMTIGETAYNVEFVFVQEDQSIRDLLKFTGATGKLSGNTFTLTLASGKTQINLYPELWDGKTVATFSNRVGCKISSSGTLYAKQNATATMTVNGVDYNVIFTGF